MLFRISVGDRASRCVANMQNLDGVAAWPIKNPERVSNNSDGPYLRTLRDTWCGIGSAANAFDDIDDPSLDGFRDRGAGIGP
jgi:hypothetical protein